MLDERPQPARPPSADGASRRRWPRRLILLVAGAAVLVAGLVAAAHLPMVRRAVLRRAITELDTRFGLALTAAGIDYNLLRLRISLDGVRLAAAGALDEPFLTADRIEATVPRSALFGAFSLDSVRLSNAHVAIVRRADGSTNLPSGTGGGTGDPPALPIGEINVPRLSLELTDAAGDFGLALPAMALELSDDDGTIRLLEPGRIRRGAIDTRVTRLDGGLAFDGRIVRTSGLQIETSEATVAADGAIDVLVAEPGLDLRLTARADVPGVARWGTTATAPAGAIAFDGTVRGPFATLAAVGRVSSGSLAWGGLTLENVGGEVAVDTARLLVPQVTARVAGGQLSVAGETAFATGSSNLSGSWTDIDLAALTRALAPAASPRPAGRAAGTIAARGTGTDLAGWTMEVRNQTSGRPPGAGELSVAGDTDLTIDAGAWRLSGRQTVATAPVEAMLSGRLNGERIAASSLEGTVRTAGADLPALIAALQTAGVIATPETLATAGQLQATATLSGTIEAPQLAFDAQGSGVAAQGISGLSATVMGQGTAARLDLTAQIAQGAANQLSATAAVLDARRLEARVTGRLADPGALRETLPIAGVVDLTFDAAGPFDQLAGRGSVTVADARYDEIRLGRIDSSVELLPTVVQIEAAIPELSARTTTRVALDGSREGAIDVTLDDADVSRLVQDLDTSLAIAGRLSASAQARGPLDDWRLGTAAVAISRFDGRFRELPFSIAAPARLTYSANTLEVGGVTATAGDVTIAVSGRLPLLEGPAAVRAAEALRVELAGDLGDIVSAATAAGLVARPDITGSGPVALLASVTGSAERPIFAGDLEISRGSLTTADLPPATAVELRLHAGDGWLELTTASAEWQGGQLNASGRIPLRLLEGSVPPAILGTQAATAGDASLTGSATGLTPLVLAPFVDDDTLAQIAGSIDISARLTSPSTRLEDLDGRVVVDRFDLRMAGIPVEQRQPTTLTIEDGVARVSSWEWVGQGTELTVTGQIGLVDRQAQLSADGRLDLRLATPFVRAAGVTLGGALEPHVRITGPLTSPELDGTLDLSGGDIRLASPQIVATELTARATLSRTTATVTELSGRVNGGTLTGNGELTFGEVGSPSSTLTATISDMALEFPEGLRSQLDAELALTVTAPAGGPLAGRVTGEVTVIESSYREPMVVVTGLLASLRSQELAAGAIEEDSVLDRLAFDVRLVTDDDVVVDNNLARLQLGADLRLIGTAQAPALSGRAELREGGQLFVGPNVYTIASGTIDFENPTTIEPDMNIQAQTRAGGEEIELTLAGTPETLDVELRSPTNPDLGEADLASLLLTGRTLDEVPGAEGNIVGQQVLGYLSGDILGVAGRAAGLDTLRLGGTDESLLRRDPTAIATETDPTTRLSVGRRLGERFEVTLSQSLREGDAQTWIIDYLATRRLNLRLVSDDDNLRAYEFRHDVAFGSAPSATAGLPRTQVEPRVVAVTFGGTLVFPEERRRDTVGIERGDTLSFENWQDARDRLETLYRSAGYREARINDRRIEGDGGVTLAFEIEAGPHTVIAVTGYGLGRQTMRALEDAWVQAIFDDFLIEEARAIVRGALGAEGYLEPMLTVGITMDTDKVLAIGIEPGPRTGRRVLAVDADDAALEDAVEDHLEDSPLVDDAWRDPEPLRQDVLRFVRSRGHLAAEVTIAAPSVGDGVATLPIAIAAGPVFTIEDLRVEGTGPRAPGAAFEIGHLDLGAPYNPVEVDVERRRLAAEYRRAGFASARVAANPMVNGETRRVAVVFTVNEGPQQVLQAIVIEGNTGIDDDVITRALDLRIGEPVGGDAWLQARARVFETGLFQRADVNVEPIAPDAAGPEQPVRARVTVREWPALRVRYGLRLAEERPIDDVEGREITPGFSADITRQTLFGRAIALGTSVDYQRRFRQARLFGGAPTLFGLPVESIVSFVRSHENRESVTLLTDRTGISWEQRVRLVPNLRLSYSYTYDRDRTFDTEPPSPGLPAFDITVNIARVTLASIWDTRNDPGDAQTGTFLSATGEHAPGHLGSDIRFIRLLGQAYHFRPWNRLTLASAARVGVVSPLSGQVLIPSERFYSGGARSVRGVAEDSLGGTDFEGFPFGGRALLILNQEVRLPIWGWLRGVGFVDAGNVFEEPGDLRFRDLVGSAGAGLRLATPVAMFRVDYARLWASSPEQRVARWTFGIGQAF